MSEDITRHLPDQTPLLEQILARFDSFEQSVNARLERLEARSYDTKPIWERALSELIELRKSVDEVADRMHKLERKFDVITTDMVELRADQTYLHRRIDKVEARETPPRS